MVRCASDRACFLQHLLEGLAVGEVGDGAVEGELGLGQFFEEAVAEEACEDADWCEEVGGPRLPRSGVDIEAAVGNEAVEVGMPLHLLVPGMERRYASHVRVGELADRDKPDTLPWAEAPPRRSRPHDGSVIR